LSDTPRVWSAFRSRLLAWYDHNRRDLPWRRTRDPYRIWLSEIMLQQTRVEAVIPYYERFLDRFPDVRALASAPEQDLLNAWSGLGYYSRARNLQRAARLIIDCGAFPRDLASLRELPGVGDYTAAAIASIAFGAPHAVLDGNVARVLARFMNERGDIRAPATRRRLQALAGVLLDAARPGDFNQAMMELGAVVCTPRNPDCHACPLGAGCAARALGIPNELPVKNGAGPRKRIESTLLIVERNGRVLMRQRPASSTRLASFWEFPEHGSAPVRAGRVLGTFRHSITTSDYTYTVRRGALHADPEGFEWVPLERLERIPLTSAAKKAVLCLLKGQSKSAR
jgi:A/G-specific adenine glycosylase